jgi:AcrR family transcriptional regulator
MEKSESLENILNVAGKSFAESGYHGVSLQEIAEDAGVSKSLIFYYFKDKKSLYETLVKKSVELILLNLKKALRLKKDPPEKISAFVQSYFELLLHEENLIRLLARETSNPESPLAAYVIRQSKKMVDMLTSIIEDGIKGGFFRKVNPRLAAISLFGMLTTYVAAKNIFARRIPKAELKSFSVKNLSKVNTEIFLEGLKKC